MPNASSSSWSGRLWITGMGLFLAAAGALFTWVLWTAWQRAEETRRWTPVPATVISARVDQERPTPHSNPTYRAELRYRFHFDGQERTGSRIRRVDSASQHEQNVRKQLEAYPVGSSVTCYVNPDMPSQTVLQHGTRAPLYSIWFPLLFVVGGIGMAANALFRQK